VLLLKERDDPGHVEHLASQVLLNDLLRGSIEGSLDLAHVDGGVEEMLGERMHGLLVHLMQGELAIPGCNALEQAEDVLRLLIADCKDLLHGVISRFSLPGSVLVGPVRVNHKGWTAVITPNLSKQARCRSVRSEHVSSHACA
jgi:hypothetical protein